MSTEPADRRVLLVAHTGRDEAREVARALTKALTAHGIVVRLFPSEAADLGLEPGGEGVGIAAEAEYDDLESTIDAVVHRRYTWEDRLTRDVSVHRDGEVIARTFALNEASVEKAARERMLEVIVEIDGRPLSRWGCDGVVCATPTGST